MGVQRHRNINVNWLGYNYFGVPLNQTHEVGIYDSAGVLLAAATITNASSSANGYLWTALPATLALGPGNYFAIGTTLGQDDGWIYEAEGIVTSPGVSYVQSWYLEHVGGVLTFPTVSTTHKEYLLVNFADTVTGVPEPASVSLLGSALVLLLIAARRR